MPLAPMCAYGKDSSLEFVDCCGYVGMEVKGDAAVKSLSIVPISSKESLSGTIKVGLADGEMTVENAPKFQGREVIMKMSQPLLLIMLQPMLTMNGRLYSSTSGISRPLPQAAMPSGINPPIVKPETSSPTGR